MKPKPHRQRLEEPMPCRASAEQHPLRENDCRFIIGDVLSEDWHYCRAPRSREKNGEPRRWRYCDDHYDECVQPQFRRRRKEAA